MNIPNFNFNSIKECIMNKIRNTNLNSSNLTETVNTVNSTLRNTATNLSPKKIGIIAGAIVLLFAVFMLFSGDSDLIIAVKESQFDKTLTYEQALSSYKYFEQGKWKEAKGDRGQPVVIFSAKVKKESLISYSSSVRSYCEGLNIPLLQEQFCNYLAENGFNVIFNLAFALNKNKKITAMEVFITYEGVDYPDSYDQSTLQRYLTSIQNNRILPTPYSFLVNEKTLALEKDIQFYYYKFALEHLKQSKDVPEFLHLDLVQTTEKGNYTSFDNNSYYTTQTYDDFQFDKKNKIIEFDYNIKIYDVNILSLVKNIKSKLVDFSKNSKQFKVIKEIKTHKKFNIDNIFSVKQVEVPYKVSYGTSSIHGTGSVIKINQKFSVMTLESTTQNNNFEKYTQIALTPNVIDNKVIFEPSNNEFTLTFIDDYPFYDLLVKNLHLKNKYHLQGATDKDIYAQHDGKDYLVISADKFYRYYSSLTVKLQNNKFETEDKLLSGRLLDNGDLEIIKNENEKYDSFPIGVYANITNKKPDNK